MRHFVVVGILVILTTILAYVGMESAGLMPVQASLQAESIDWLWNLEVVVIAFLFSLIVVPLTYSLVVFRRRKGDTTDAAHVEGNTTLEITWTVIPLITVVVFAYLGSYSLADTQRVAPDAMVVKVTGLQWSWKFQYPDLGITTTDLVTGQYSSGIANGIHGRFTLVLGTRIPYQAGCGTGTHHRISCYPNSGGEF
jgi:cytochrome c oxidase subunit 2